MEEKITSDTLEAGEAVDINQLRKESNPEIERYDLEELQSTKTRVGKPCGHRQLFNGTYGAYSYVCTRQMNHHGAHVAHCGDTVYAVWSNNSLDSYTGTDEITNFTDPRLDEVFNEKELEGTYEKNDKLWCAAGSPTDYVCTRSQGHSGPHVGHISSSAPVVVWNDPEVEPDNDEEEEHEEEFDATTDLTKDAFIDFFLGDEDG